MWLRYEVDNVWIDGDGVDSDNKIDIDSSEE